MGYCAFGEVIEGMDVVDAIAKTNDRSNVLDMAMSL